MPPPVSRRVRPEAQWLTEAARTNLWLVPTAETLGAALLFIPFELQHVMGYGAAQAGFALLPAIALIALGSPIQQTRASYFLGMALEGKGDLEGAKKAYQLVIDRWGAAKPKSRTAEEAKKRLKQLE